MSELKAVRVNEIEGLSKDYFYCSSCEVCFKDYDLVAFDPNGLFSGSYHCLKRISVMFGEESCGEQLLIYSKQDFEKEFKYID